MSGTPGVTLAARWESFTKYIPAAATPFQVEQLRLAFFAGAYEMFDLGVRTTPQEFQNIRKELNNFIETHTTSQKKEEDGDGYH